VIKKKPIFFKNTADGQLVFLGTEDITKIIRTNEVTNNVSKISALGAVREFLVAEQQRIADEGGIIMDGRDIGTGCPSSCRFENFPRSVCG
jgi:cytidylate kinase